MGESGQARKVLRFGTFEFEPQSGQLRKRGLKIKLRDKSVDVLTLLLERQGEVVSREELRARLWPADVFVDFDNNLNSAVNRLREALGDSAEDPKLIETIPRRGYRFIGALSPSPPPLPEGAPRRTRLAVLPFDNLSGDDTQDYFSDGMTEELITALACLAPEQLGVVARTSSMHYKGSRKDVARVARELDLNYVVEGSVRRAGDRVRICAQLISASDRTHLWANSYDAELRDSLKLQSEVAEAIAHRIGVAVSPVAIRRRGNIRPIAPEAYDDYLKGLYQLSRGNPSGFEKGAACFRSAVEQDPLYAAAHAKLGFVNALGAFFGYAPHGEAFPRAESAARRAVELDETLAEAHSALALVNWFYYWDCAACEREAERAIELSPNDTMAHWTMAAYLGSMKEDHQRAEEEAMLAQSLDPLSIAIRSTRCWLPFWARQYDRAIAQTRSVIELDENCAQAYDILGASARSKGAFHEAIPVLEEAVRRFGDPLSLAYLGMAYGLAGQHEAAQAILHRLQDCGAQLPSIFTAYVYAGLGETERALDAIEKAFDEHHALVLWLRVSPDWDLLRNEPRFLRLQHRLPLPVPEESRLRL